jgi:hypothetical protein
MLARPKVIRMPAGLSRRQVKAFAGGRQLIPRDRGAPWLLSFATGHGRLKKSARIRTMTPAATWATPKDEDATMWTRWIVAIMLLTALPARAQEERHHPEQAPEAPRAASPPAGAAAQVIPGFEIPIPGMMGRGGEMMGGGMTETGPGMEMMGQGGGMMGGGMMRRGGPGMMGGRGAGMGMGGEDAGMGMRCPEMMGGGPGMMSGGMMGGGMMHGAMMGGGMMLMDSRVPPEKREPLHAARVGAQQALLAKRGVLQAAQLGLSEALRQYPLDRQAVQAQWRSVQAASEEMLKVCMDLIAEEQRILGEALWKELHPRWKMMPRPAEPTAPPPPAR